MWKSLIEKIKGKNGRKGYTLTELLVVIGIIAVVCAIAIPSIIMISRNLKFRQRNDYAKTIFMAAQQNLSEMRSDGGLVPLQQAGIGSYDIAEGMSGFPAEHWSDEYQYTTSRQADVLAYSLVLPTGSVESALRDQQVIIEYNPITGNVYSVFYSEERESIVDQYTGAGLPRASEADRKKMMLGYYDGSGLSSSLLELEDTRAEVDFTNDEEGIVTVMIPMPSLYYGDHTSFIEGLQVTLTVTGDTSNGEFQTVIKEIGDVSENCTLDVDGQTVLITYALDSLYEMGSFANLAAKPAASAEGAAALGGSAKYLTEMTAETEFNIIPGENVTIQADVEFSAPSGKAAVKVESGILPGVNPMFESLEPGITDNKYILTVSNGRNLQNLNAIAPSVAAQVESVVFTGDIYWNKTVAYYNEKYGNTGHTFSDVGPDGGTADGVCDSCGHLSYHGVHGSSKIYASPSQEAPARALPYFVPIHNAALFGTANFTYYSTSSGNQSFWDQFFDSLEDIFGDGTQAQFNANVPTLTDEMDAGGHAVISGDDKNAEDGDTDTTAQIYYLNIDTTQYCVGKAYYAGTANADLDRFTGLFSYVNTSIDNLEVVNPTIKGYTFTENNNPATGALIGAAGYNTLVTDCGVYIDTEDSAFSRTAMSQTYYDADAAQTWYGVSGQGAVGGLVGYAKSHRTVAGELDGDEARLAFSNCFAAVNVSGTMRGGESRNYGYSNGVGGIIGNSQLTNFYNCYASGNVWSTGSYEDSRWNDDMTKYLGLYLDGATSMGTGGFVGTSHGTRYTNCFATGNVINGAGTQATGGFVGLMCYDETFAYGHHSNLGIETVAQHTVFDSCYSVGLCSGAVNGGTTYLENFSGANGRIGLTYNNIKAYYTGDYYRLLAPYYLQNQVRPNYATEYIFKDSYYLSQYTNTTQDSSNKCAMPITYDDLCDLLSKHHTSTGQNEMLASLKTQGIDAQAVRTFADSLFNSGGLAEMFEKLNVIFRDSTYNVYFRLGEMDDLDLDSIYLNAYAEGFPSAPWKMDSNGDATFSYAEGIVSDAYPFPMLNTMNYYGEWPTRPRTAGIAYFEDYTIVSDGTTTTATGYYFDRADTSSLRSYEGVTIVSDGYAIFSANENDSITVQVNGKEVAKNLKPEQTAVTMYSSSSPDANSYYVTRLPQSVLAEAARSTSFFSKLTVTINGTSYTMYFNPNVAIGHSNSSTAPSRIPSQMYIRSARQLAGLSVMQSGWGAGYNYVQQMDIDASKYTASGYSDADKSTIKGAITNAATIGNANAAFKGSYSGSGGYVEQASIAGFDGIFGTIGQKASVKDLILTYGDTESKATVSLGTANDDSIGLLAYVNNGIIENVDLRVTGTVALTAKNNAGLLAGFSGGTVADCDILVSDAVTVTAPNAGGAVGKIVKAAVSNSNVDFKAFSATGANVGGFVGSAQDLTADKLTVTVDNGMNAASAEYVGGFAGTITTSAEGTSSVTSVSTNLTGAVSAAAASGKTATGAGVAGSAANVTFAGVHARIYGTISGDAAAGMFGTTEKVTVNNSSATVTKAITGNTVAAGIAGTIGADSEFTNTAVNLTGATVKATSGKAAGYAAELAGKVVGGNVSMGVSINGTDAAGFACAVTGTVNNSTVAGTGTITGANNAAGFALTLSGKDARIAAGKVTLASVDSAKGYLNHKYGELTVSGANAAGFILTNDATVVNSTVVGAVSGSSKTAGFALTNNGAIERSYSNVSLSENATAFAGTNASTVTNSYGWYMGGTADSTGTYTGCYFAPLGINGKTARAQLFDSAGASTQVTLDELTKDVLNGTTGTAWFQASTYGAYPMTDNGVTEYPYPMLRLHYGDWVNPPEYSYGVAYYESYLDTDGKTVRYNVQLLDTSDATNNMAGGAYSMNTISDSVAIVDAGYALFYHTDAQISSTSMAGAVVKLDTANFPNLKTDLKLNGAALTDTQWTDFTTHGYSLKLIDAYKNKVYAANEALPVTITGASKGQATIYPGFAKAIVAKGGNALTSFEVRTCAQLSNIDCLTADHSAAQTMNIILPSGFAAVNFSGAAYTGNSKTITTVDSGVFGTVSGSISGLTIATASTTATDGTTNLNPVSGSLIANVNGGTISDITFSTGKIGANSSLIGTTSGTVTVKVANTVDVEGSVIGTVSGGTVTVTDGLSVGTVSGNVIGTVSGGSISGTITTGNVSGSVIGAVNAAVTSDIDVTGTLSGNVFGTVASGKSVSGSVDIAVQSNSVVGELKGAVSGLTVTANSATLSAGALVNTFADTGSVTGSSISVTNGVTVDSGVNFGMIAANIPAGASVTDTTVAGTINVTGADGKTAVVGGMVATNAGTITGGSANVTINYTQAASDEATIGGLVGSNSGTISGTGASGAINLLNTSKDAQGNAVAPSGAGRSYIVGGAVGADAVANTAADSVEYQNITANVTVAPVWATKTAAGTLDCPGGKGAVGMFVGNVTNGTFNTCSSTGENSAYQFLGQIAVSTYELSSDSSTATDWFSHAGVNGSAAENSADNIDVGVYAGYTRIGDGYTYSNYAASLTACEFKFGTAAYKQLINVTEYFYLGTESHRTRYSATRDGVLNASEVTLKYSDLHKYEFNLWGDNPNENVETEYYYYKNGTYYKVFVDESVSGFIRYTYTYRLEDNNGNELVTLTTDSESNTVGTTLYTLSGTFTEGSGLYIMADSTGAKALAITSDGTSEAITMATSFDSSNDMYRTIWDIGSGSLLNISSNRYLNLATGDFTSTSGNGIIANAYVGNSIAADGQPNFVIGCNNSRYVTWNGSVFSSGTTGTALNIYKVSVAGTFWHGEFVYQNLYNQLCTTDPAIAAVSESSLEFIQPVGEIESTETEPVATTPTETTSPTDGTVGGDTQNTATE